MNQRPADCIMASGRNGTLYIGVAGDLPGRAWQDREHMSDGFTQRCNVNPLVWFELHETFESAITREKRIKQWRRTWKAELIEKNNPYRHDL